MRKMVSVSKEKLPYVIAEAGFNHEGDMSVASKMVKAAATAGADAIKFQTYRAGDIVLSSSLHFKEIRCGELNLNQHMILAETARDHKIDFLSTPYSPWAVDLLEKVGVNAYKISSMDITNLELLKYVAETRKAIFISSGMASLKEICSTVNLLRRFKSGPVTILHCISKYPAEPNEINLSFMDIIRRVCRCDVGYSDHAKGTMACLTAAILGASVIEKHFTLDASLPGADHYHSASPEQLRELIGDIKHALSIIGRSGRIGRRTDRKNARLFRRGIYALLDIPKGVKISRDMLVCCRPEAKLSVADLSDIVGRVSRRDINAQAPISRKVLLDRR